MKKLILFLNLLLVISLIISGNSDNSKIIKNKLSFNKKIIYYAKKNNYKVNVIKENLNNNKIEILLTYNEAYKAELSGNTWEEKTPSTFFDMNNNLFIYTDINGLNSYNIINKKTNNFIKKTSDIIDEVAGYKWSINNIEDTFFLADPIKLNNDIYFKLAHYEGNTFGKYNLDKNDFILIKDDDNYYDILNISLSNNKIILEKINLPFNFGLNYIDENNKIIDISNENDFFSTAYTSANGEIITYGYTPFKQDIDDPEPVFYDYNVICYYNIKDKKHYVANDDKIFKTNPIISNDNKFITYLVKNDNFIEINQYDIENKKNKKIMNIKIKAKYIINSFITNDDYYCFEIIYEKNNKENKCFYIIDYKNKKILLVKQFDYFTRIIGLE